MSTVSRNTFAELKQRLNAPIDVFLCCASFEERCRTVASVIAPNIVLKAFVAKHTEAVPSVDENARYIAELFGEKAVAISLDRFDPILTADTLKKVFEGVSTGNPVHYVIDITTFTHEALLILLMLIRHYIRRGDHVSFVYTSAAEYAPGLVDNQKWLSKGVKDVRSVLGYPGVLLPSRKTHLVILVGYEHERASRLMEISEPDVISLGYGIPETETSPKHTGANSYFKKLVGGTAARYAAVRDFEFSCSDPWEAKTAISKQVAQYPDHNAIIAPMNTKISTVGSALAAFENEAIQLCYAQAVQYNMRYSEPGDHCDIFELPELYPR